MIEVMLGGIVIFMALGFMTYLVVRSLRTIRMIRRKKMSSARDILKEMHGSR